MRNVRRCSVRVILSATVVLAEDKKKTPNDYAIFISEERDKDKSVTNTPSPSLEIEEEPDFNKMEAAITRVSLDLLCNG